MTTFFLALLILLAGELLLRANFIFLRGDGEAIEGLFSRF
jgi:hypothetical protein